MQKKPTTKWPDFIKTKWRMRPWDIDDVSACVSSYHGTGSRTRTWSEWIRIHALYISLKTFGWGKPKYKS